MKIDKVEVPGLGDCNVVPGAEVIKEKVIAGKGCKTNTIFRGAERHVIQYGGRAERWQKMRGEVPLIIDGEIVRSEIHWVQEPTVGEFDFTFIRRLW